MPGTVYQPEVMLLFTHIELDLTRLLAALQVSFINISMPHSFSIGVTHILCRVINVFTTTKGAQKSLSQWYLFKIKKPVILIVVYHPRKFDATIAKIIAKLPQRYYPVMFFVSYIGGTIFAALTLLFLSVLFLASMNVSLLTLIALTALFTPLAEFIKLATRRKRPETLYVENMRFKTYSFPSGHAYVSSLSVGLLITIGAITLASPLFWILSILLVSFSFIVGISRIYLGAHFPSDVLAGWLLGILVLLLINTVWLAL